MRRVPRSLRVCDRAELGDALPDRESGAAAALRLDVGSGAGGASDSGATGPDPGGGNVL